MGEKGMETGWQADDEKGKAWLQYASSLPQAQDWRFGLSALWYIARSQPDTKVILATEVQIIYEPYMVGRSLSHLLFKVSRCETGPDEMARDFAHGFADEGGTVK